MNQEERVLQILKETEVLMEGHFLLSSGRHSDQYMQCARVFQYPAYSEELSRMLAAQLKGMDIDMVIAPAIGGIVFSYEMGRVLGVKTLFAERENGAMTLRRGFSIEPGSKVLVVEDAVTTGGTVKEVIAFVQSLGAEVVGVGSVVDRSGGTVDFGVPFHAVYRTKIESYTADACPICKEGKIPLIKPGSRNLPV
jgi:orotate phosphoribosyltransferase